MKSLFKNLVYLFLALIALATLSACQSVKEGLTGTKRSNSDEFLVEKKNPLVLPPEFNKLPKPSNSKIDKKNDKNENKNLEKLIGAETDKEISNKDSTKDNSLENSILKTLNDD